MLEADEVDDDFFTPITSTSLANLFGNINKTGEGQANDSLKYVPPKPQNPIPKQEPIKSTECIFACVLIGHEWLNNVYTSKGKLGFAIVKVLTTGAHNIVLYDSNKTSLSCTTISTKLEVTIKNEIYICYFDNLKKYWSVYGTKEEIKKVADLLTSLGVNITYSSYIDQGPPQPTNNVDNKTDIAPETSEKKDKGSDTDSSINRKTKASILNRMANMGHSVLPARAITLEKTSDSSDTMETETQTKPVRHKPVKNIMKRNNMENMHESHQITESHNHQRMVLPKTESLTNIPLYTSHPGQLLPITSTNVFTTPGNELSMFISEQRISNSELRINMSRITDKVDSVLNKISNFEHKGTTNAHTDILMKLLTEYENKIRVYEKLLKTREEKSVAENKTVNNDIETETLKNKICEFEKINEEKSNEVLNLQKDIELLKSKYTEERLNYTIKEEILLKKINSLESNLKEMDEELTDILTKYDNIAANTNVSNEISDKVKNIMNDTFQTISVNFKNNENYTGETVKKIVGTVIKKITMQTLNEL